MKITTTFVHNDLTGPKIVAKGGGKQRTVSYDHALSEDANHGTAAGTLALVLGWLPSDEIAHNLVAAGKHTFIRLSA